MAKRYIRNYTVIQKNVKVGEENKLLNYLLSDTHKNHLDTIIHCDNSPTDYSDLLFLRKQANDFNYMKNKKGGRKLKDIAKSITFNIPPDFKSTAEDLKIILNEIKSSLDNYFHNNDINLNYEDMFSVIHEQSNNHIHMVLPMLDANGKNIRRFKEPSFLIELKIIFTEAVDKHFNKNVKEYQQLTAEERKHNATRKELERLKREYQHIINTDTQLNEKTIKYLKNEIIKIERLLNNSEDTIQAEMINMINKNLDKLNRAQSNIYNLKPIQ